MVEIKHQRDENEKKVIVIMVIIFNERAAK